MRTRADGMVGADGVVGAIGMLNDAMPPSRAAQR
jgi:hypothetical protein